MIDRKLMSILACPKCKGDVKEKGMFLMCSKCRLAYPCLGGVPDMLIEDAWPVEKAEKAGFRHNIKL
ncbi:MAG: Trm112 family protein [Candidatus Aenigmarchaeota archaeon]|nr:Trm112 family protein [Candidatus Aenigmarchaeota archaeon]